MRPYRPLSSGASSMPLPIVSYCNRRDRPDRRQSGYSSFCQVRGSAGCALAVLPNGRLLAGDMQQGLLVSLDGGRTWRRLLRAQVMGLAVNPADPSRLLATGGGIALSTDGGRTWRSVLDLSEGAGPVAWSKSNPKLAYTVGFDRRLYRSSNGGQSWKSVEGS